MRQPLRPLPWQTGQPPLSESESTFKGHSHQNKRSGHEHGMPIGQPLHERIVAGGVQELLDSADHIRRQHGAQSLNGSLQVFRISTFKGQHHPIVLFTNPRIGSEHEFRELS